MEPVREYGQCRLQPKLVGLQFAECTSIQLNLVKDGNREDFCLRLTLMYLPQDGEDRILEVDFRDYFNLEGFSESLPPVSVAFLAAELRESGMEQAALNVASAAVASVSELELHRVKEELCGEVDSDEVHFVLKIRCGVGAIPRFATIPFSEITPFLAKETAEDRKVS